MSEPYPILVNEVLEAHDGAIVGIEEDLSECAELRGAVPAITTVHQHVLALKQTAHHMIGSLDYQEHVVVPLRLGEVHVEPGVFSQGGLQGFAVGLPNGVDVGNVEKLYLAIRVKLLGLIPLACYFIAEGCHLISGIENDTIGGTLRLIYITIILPFGSASGLPMSLSMS